MIERQQANLYGQTLGQNTSRKLALLVGINDYPSGMLPLQGCLTDIEMQRELLIHRFGFNPQDIWEVKNKEATRENILTAFEEHLIKQAEPGDVVLFHYSGHGTQVEDPNPIKNQKHHSTLVPIDAEILESDNVVRGIMGRTLFLLMSAIHTENLTVVLDSCYSGGGIRGNLVIRSARLGGGQNRQATPEEFEYQQRWLKELGLSPEEFQRRREQGIAKGVALAAAKDDRSATDAPFKGFHAGAFSYLLTRYLWQQTDNDAVGKIFVNLALRTHDVADSSNVIQDPHLEVKPGSNNESEFLYFSKQVTLGAEGVIRNVKGNEAEFWLGGVASQTLESYQAGAIFSRIDNHGHEIGLIEQQRRNGLVGDGKVTEITQPHVVQPGALLRERVREIPTNLTLKLGLDSSVGDRTTIPTMRRIDVVSVNQTDPVDYILGRVTEDDFHLFQQQQILNAPPVGAIGLFTVGRKPIPDTFGSVGESVEEAIQQRLRSRLMSLLAERILHMLVTGESSPLKVAVTVQPVGGTVNPNTVSSRGNQEFFNRQVIKTEPFKVGTTIQIQVENNEDRNLYVSVVVIDSSGNLIVLFPLDWDAPEDSALVAPKQIIAVPQPSDNFEFHLTGPSGTLEVLVLTSVKPVRNALKGLKNLARSRNVGRGNVLELSEDELLQVMDNLLGDLDEMTRASITITRKDVQAVDVAQLAAISTMIEVVEGEKS